MTTRTAPTTPTTAPSRTPLLLALGIGGSALLTAVGTFLDLTGNDTHGKSGGEQLSEWLVVLSVSAVVAALLFALVVRRAATGDAGRRSLVLGVLALLSVAVFWSGLPSVLAAAAVGCALVERDRRGSFGGSATSGLVLSALAVMAAVYSAIDG